MNCRVPAADMIKLLDVKAETEDKIEEDGAAPASASLKLECGKIALESRGGAKAQTAGVALGGAHTRYGGRCESWK